MIWGRKLTKPAKDTCQSQPSKGLGLGWAKGGPPDINIAQILHLSNFFELKRRVYIHVQAWRTRKVLDIQLVYHTLQI